MALTTGPPPEVVRQRLLSILSVAAAVAVTTSDLRHCLSEAFNLEFVHEHVYHNLVVLERRGDVTRVARAPGSGRHTLWALNAASASVDR